MKKIGTVVLAVLAVLVLVISSPVYARGGGRGGGGGHGGGHFGGSHIGGGHIGGGHIGSGHIGGYRGGYISGYHGGHPYYRGGVRVPYRGWGYRGPHYRGWGWPYYYPSYWGWPYSYPYYWGWPYSSYYPNSSYPISPALPVEPQQQQPNYWYFCQDPQGYYPYVKECPGGWMQVIPSVPSNPNAIAPPQ